ncbi:MAG: ArsR/SmtB family transcription factor [Candidatus Sericytochromatia bacterium]
MKAQEARQSCCSSPETQPSFPADLGEKARLFKALGDEIRLKLLHLVREQEVCVCDLMPMVGMAQSTLSHHLSVLQQAGLVTVRKQGRWNYYLATDLAQGSLEVFESASGSLLPLAPCD